MSQITISGKYVNAAQQVQTGNFVKQSIIVEVTNGTYISYFNLEFHQADVQNIFPQLQPNGFFNFTCWVQGSNKQFTDKNNQPVAYTTLKCTSVAPAQPTQQAAPANGFSQPAPATQPQGFGGQQSPAPNFGGQPQGGIGQPQQFTQPAQQFNQQPAQPAQQFGGQPAQQAAPAPTFNPNAGQ